MPRHRIGVSVRALLVYNPNATTTTPAVTDVITAALAKDLKLDVVPTKRRHHASYLAAGAVHEGHELVVALGGDGTVNEVLQGIARTPVRLGIIPGGSTNVLARSLGLPADAIEATSMLLRYLAQRRERTINLGRADERYFAFNLGFGLDAEAVRYVERRYRLKRTVRQASFVYCGALAYFGGYDRKARIHVTVDGANEAADLRTVVCCNTNPYAYLGSRPVQLCPQASFDAGLDVLGLTRMGLPSMLRLLARALGGDKVPALPFVRTWHDQGRYELVAERPLPLQVDGDLVGDCEQVTVALAERAVTVIA